MDKQNEQVNEFLPELITTFEDLAHLSHHGVSTIIEGTSSVADVLLKRLIILCQASQGAIYLATSSPVASASAFPSLALRGKFSRRLALYNVNEEEVQALLMPFSPESLWTSPSWLHWRFPLTLAFFSEQATYGNLQEQGDSLPVLHALVLLGWREQNAEYRSKVMEKACVVLPFIADAVGTVIARLLAHEYIYELETGADRKALREMDLLKAELLATVSHELRSPLASIKGYAATLLRHERRISREERHEFLLAIHESSDRLAAVIDALLEMSELQTGTIELEPTAINVFLLVREAASVAEQRLYEAEGAASSVLSPSQLSRFAVHLKSRHGEPADEELMIEADPNRLSEVLDQLLKNAMMHAPQSGVVDVTVYPVLSLDDLNAFSLSSRETMKNITAVQQHFQRVVVIGVHDSGQGVSPQHMPRIFDPFYRVDTRLTRETSGIGLGLAISRRIVELHGGMLWAESEVGKGSTFYICLPRDSGTDIWKTKPSIQAEQ